MNWKSAIAAAAALSAMRAMPALADELAMNAREAMREAMREQAPLPSGPATLPDRMAPVVPRAQLATKAEANRAAREHARKNAAAARDEVANRAAMRPMMGDMKHGSGQAGCDKQLPADMMKSRGTMPGGGMMPGGGDGGQGGKSGGGMQFAPSSTPGSLAPAGAQR